MDYIVHRRFKDLAICGEVNLRATTKLTERDETIYWGDKELCSAQSQNAYDYFARDDDGCGMLRGKLTRGIRERLRHKDDEYQARWDKVWDDEECQRFKSADHADRWVWNHDFYNATIEDLRHIAALVGAKEE